MKEWKECLTYLIKWICKFSKILRARINEVVIPEDAKKIQIIELDELYYQKN